MAKKPESVPASEIKHMDIKEFCDLGFLQEVNRLVLHPCGLALEVTVDDDDETKQWISGVWDYRDDPEGVYFDWKAWEGGDQSLAKANSVTSEANRHREARESLFANLYPEYHSSDPTIEPVIVNNGQKGE